MYTNRIRGVATSRQDNAFKLKPLSQGLAVAHAALLGFAICVPLQASAADEQEAAQLAPMVITGVAERVPARIAHLIYLDAFILPSGTSTFDTLPAKMVESMTASAGKSAVPAVPPPPLTVLSLHAAEDQHFVGNRLTPQPLSVYHSSLRLQNPVIGNARPCSYISCTQPTFRGVDTSREWARQQKDWEFRELESGHSAAITHPDMLSRLLLELAD